MSEHDLKAYVTSIRDAAIAALALLPADPVPQPETLSTAQQLIEACMEGGDYVLADGEYLANVVIRQPTRLSGTRNAGIRPLDLFEPTILGLASDSSCSGFTVRNGMPDRECVVIGDVYATSAEQQPYRVTLDDLAIIAGLQGGHRGIALHGAHLAVTRCDVTNFWEAGRDSQAVWIHNGPGPYLIEDCVLEASGENILLGGAAIHIPNCVPSDVTIRRNVLPKPQAWKTYGAQIKNAFEVKNGRRVFFQDNIIDGWWVAEQQAPIQLTPRNQDGGSPWATVEDIEIARTVFQNVEGGFAVNILGTDNERHWQTGERMVSQQARDIRIHHNLFAGSASFLQLLGGVAGALILDHNTVPHVTNRLFSFDRIAGDPDMLTPLTFTANVVRTGEYGISGAGLTVGLPSLEAYCTLVQWMENVIEQNAPPDRPMAWPEGQTTLAAGELASLLDPVTLKMLAGTAGY
jgi:hypothetical protein